jgi:dihydrodiol dehydrogenase / D-xylose 1-dehydrogenase (NADP)
MQLKWGLVGTGNICEDFCLALLTCDSREHAIVAVSSREKTKADEFVKKFGLGNDVRTYGSQEEIFQDANVDIVYIGTISEYHRDLSVKALNNNKHVLCEKPLAMNTEEVQDIIDAARKTKKFMMEAIWSRFFPIYNHLRNAVKEIGTVNYQNEE